MIRLNSFLVTVMSFFKNKEHRPPDEENGPLRTGEPPTLGEPHAKGSNDDSDHNDRFWKLFLEEATSEAKWKVSVGQTELESLLLFAGLFAAVISAFLVDLRLHLRPDPQVLAINRVAAILLNDTSPAEMERPSSTVRAVGYLWYGSLVVTLTGAFAGVLAKGWLGGILRETAKNPADRALERWRRDEAAKIWHMEKVIASVPLLLELALVMFMIGFVIQSFDDDHGIGIEVLVFVFLAGFAYEVVTSLPRLHPDCPYRSPFTNLLPTSPITYTKTPDNVNAAQDTITGDTTTGSKIQILVSRLNRSSNDEIFCSAASMLDVKLESHDSDEWYDGIEEDVPAISGALFVRLKNFAHRVQTTTDGPFSTHVAVSTANNEAFMGPLHSQIEQGAACLRVLLKFVEASISRKHDRSRWITHEIDYQWRTSNILPEAWRLLSLSIHITRLVAKEADYKWDQHIATDWENVIGKTFPNLTLRSILGSSACRGLLQGEKNLRRACALGLAMFIETEAITPTDSGKHTVFDKGLVFGKGKVITKRLWNELANISKDSVSQLLWQTYSEGDEETSFVRFLDQELYGSEIKSSISEIIPEQLDSENWNTRRQAVWMFTKIAEYDKFHAALETSGVISKVTAKLKDSDEDVRAAAVKALSTFSKQAAFTQTIKTENIFPRLIATLADHDSDVRATAAATLLALNEYRWYESDIKSSIPAIIEQLDDDRWRVREQSIQILEKLSELEVFQDTLNDEAIIPRIISKLEDNDSDVRAAAFTAVLAFSAYDLYKDNVKLSIPTIIKQLDNAESWSIREKAVQILVKFSDFEAFQETIKNEATIPKVASKLEDEDEDVREAAVRAMAAFGAHELYGPDLKLSVPIIIKQLDNESWQIREQTIRILIKLSETEAFREILNVEGIIPKIITKFEDSDSDVRAAAIAAMLAFNAYEVFQEKMNKEGIFFKLVSMLEEDVSDVRSAAVTAMVAFSAQELYQNNINLSIPTVVSQLDHTGWATRLEAVRILTKLSDQAVFQETMKANSVVTKLIGKIEDGDEDVRTAVIQALLAFSTQRYFKEMLTAENFFPTLFGRLSDSYSSVRSAALQAMSILSVHEVYINYIKSSVSTLVKQLQDDDSWSARQQAVQILMQFASNVELHEAINNENTVSILVGKLTDRDEDVRAAAVEAISVFGLQEAFEKTLKFEKVVSKLTAKLSDTFGSVCIAAQSAILALCSKEFYQNDIKSTIPAIIKQLEDDDWSTRLQIVQMLEKLSEYPAFHETLKNEGAVTKLAAKLDDSDEDVRAAAAQALSALGIKGPFKEKFKTEKVIPKLVAKLTDPDREVSFAVHNALSVLGSQEDVTEFLQIVVSTLHIVDSPVRAEVYKLLSELKQGSKDEDRVLKEIDATICDLLTRMKGQDLSYIYRSIAILTETANEGLIGNDLKERSAANKTTRDAVESVLRTPLVYGKNSPDRSDVVLALSRLAKNDLFLHCMKPAISGLIEAVSSSDRNIWSVAAEIISIISAKDEFRLSLVPAIQKLIQQLSGWGWDDDDVYPLELVESMSSLVQYKEFQNKLKHVVPLLMKQMKKDVGDKPLNPDSDKNEVAFYRAACKLISQLCEKDAVGRDLVPLLIGVLSNMDVSLTDDLFDLVSNLVNHVRLTMNDRIALVSSLRMISAVPPPLEVHACKLNIAVLLVPVPKSEDTPTEDISDDTTTEDTFSDDDYNSFLGIVLGNDDGTVKSRLSMLFPEKAVEPH